MLRSSVGMVSLFCCLVLGCVSVEIRAEEKPPSATFQKIEELHADGVHNLFRVSERIYSGSQPEGDTGFASLKKLGIKTVISVDGARPEIEIARKYGMKYVHLPIGYDGIPRETMLRLAKAVLVLPGPFFVHCHHGKHRGPAAVAAIGLCTDKGCRASDAAAFMQQAKTDPKYKGLYAVPEKFQPPTEEELKRIAPEFPETAAVDDLTEAMTRVDHEFEILLPLTMEKAPNNAEQVKQAAVLLNEHFREIERFPETKDRSEEYRQDLRESVQFSEKLYQLLQGEKKEQESRKMAKALKQTCTRCHERDRDNR